MVMNTEFWFVCVFFFFAAVCNVQDLSSLTRYQTHAPCTGSTESQPQAHQGSPNTESSRGFGIHRHLLSSPLSHSSLDLQFFSRRLQSLPESSLSPGKSVPVVPKADQSKALLSKIGHALNPPAEPRESWMRPGKLVSR